MKIQELQQIIEDNKTNEHICFDNKIGDARVVALAKLIKGNKKIVVCYYTNRARRYIPVCNKMKNNKKRSWRI